MSRLNSQEPKPPREPYDYTICLEYTSPPIESDIFELSRKMSLFLIDFNLNIAFRSVKVRKLFSYQAKPQIDKFEKNNLIYEFDCTCDGFYIGETRRTLMVRLKEHRNTACSNICAHINMCEKYENDATTFVRENEQEFPDPESARFDFFKNKFKIIDIGFRNDNDREKSEAFLIRTKRPTINDQFDSKLF